MSVIFDEDLDEYIDTDYGIETLSQPDDASADDNASGASKTPELIPDEKINGLRFGQLIYAAITNHGVHYKANMVDTCNPDTPSSGSADHFIADKLFEIENHQLKAAIERVLNE